MTDLIAILLGVVVVNVLVLPRIPLLFPPLARGARDAALVRLVFLLPLTVAPATVVTWLTGHHLLQPARLPELLPLVAMAVTLVLAEATTRAAGGSPAVPRGLLAFNSVAAGLALLASAPPSGVVTALVAGAGTAAVLALLNLCFGELKARYEAADLPLAWRGAGIALVTAGILALGLSGFAGIWRG